MFFRELWKNVIKVVGYKIQPSWIYKGVTYCCYENNPAQMVP